MKKAAYSVCCFVLALLFFLQVNLSFPVLAASENKTDVIISVRRENGYSYAIDILFKNISFVYKLESVAVNSETGERYVNSGKWLEQGGAPASSFDVEVVNRSDTPIRAETEFFTADFHRCGVEITVKTDGEEILPAVLLKSERKTVYELKTSAVFGIYPELSSYKGQKSISATVKIDRADGITTDGYPFKAREK